VRLPTARAHGIERLEIIVDAHERYPYTFTAQQVRTLRRGLPAGDYAVNAHDRVIAAVERKSLPDLASSLTSGRLKYALGELAALPRAAVVIEDRYSRIFSLDHVPGRTIADGLAELQILWPTVPMVFMENRKLAEEWTYRYLAAASMWGTEEPSSAERIATSDNELSAAPQTPRPTTRELREWARAKGLAVSDRGRLRPEIQQAWEEAHRRGA
jgi:hypothetical protein